MITLAELIGQITVHPEIWAELNRMGNSPPVDLSIGDCWERDHPISLSLGLTTATRLENAPSVEILAGLTIAQAKTIVAALQATISDMEHWDPEGWYRPRRLHSLR